MSYTPFLFSLLYLFIYFYFFNWSKFSWSTLNLYGWPYSSKKPIVYKPPRFYIGFLAFTTLDLVGNLVGILYIIFNVVLYTVVAFLVNDKMNEWMIWWYWVLNWLVHKVDQKSHLPQVSWPLQDSGFNSS